MSNSTTLLIAICLILVMGLALGVVIYRTSDSLGGGTTQALLSAQAAQKDVEALRSDIQALTKKLADDADARAAAPGASAKDVATLGERLDAMNRDMASADKAAAADVDAMATRIGKLEEGLKAAPGETAETAALRKSVAELQNDLKVLTQYVAQKTAQSKMLTAQGLEIKDDLGRTVARLADTRNGPALVFLDELGRGRAAVSATGTWLYDTSGRLRAAVFMDGNDPCVKLLDEDGRERVSLPTTTVLRRDWHGPIWRGDRRDDRDGRDDHRDRDGRSDGDRDRGHGDRDDDDGATTKKIEYPVPPTASWRQLRPLMSKLDVRKLLGDPDPKAIQRTKRLDGTVETWNYGTGWVRFSPRARVEGWREP